MEEALLSLGGGEHTWRVAIGGGCVDERLLLLVRAQQCAALIHPCRCSGSLWQRLALAQALGHFAALKRGKARLCSCNKAGESQREHVYKGMGILSTVGPSRTSSAAVTGDSCRKLADGALSTTARELNSSNIRSRSSGLCSSAKWEMAGRGAPTTRSASLTLCCSSLKSTNCH